MGEQAVEEKPRQRRREMILEAAAQLFFKQGYAETGIDDIGAAVGVTGPAFYRHFDSKQDLLIALVERAVEHLQAIVDRALAHATGPDEALRLLVEYTAQASVDDGPLTAIYSQEARHLPPEARARLNQMHRRMRSDWVGVLRQLRPEASDAELLLVVHAVGLLLTAAATYRGTLKPAEQKDVLVRLTLAALDSR